MEKFPSKIAKAVYVAAPMLKNGQSTLDIFSIQVSLSSFLWAPLFLSPHMLSFQSRIFIFSLSWRKSCIKNDFLGVLQKNKNRLS